VRLVVRIAQHARPFCAGAVVSTDGPFVETKEFMASFYILEANDLDGALPWALYATYYGHYEIRLFFADAAHNDPIIEAAASAQGWLARQVDARGVWPLLAALAVLAVAAVGWRAQGSPRRLGEGRLGALTTQLVTHKGKAVRRWQCGPTAR